MSYDHSQYFKNKSLWLALRFSQLPIDIFERSQLALNVSDNYSGSYSEKPIAVVDQQQVTHCNALASSKGVLPGINTASASALCDDLTVIERRIEQEEKAIEQIAQSLYRWTPDVVVESVDVILLEVSACLQLFKGLKPIVKGLARELSEQAYGFQLGLAHTPKAACLLSYSDRPHVLRCFDFGKNIFNKPLLIQMIKIAAIDQLSIAEPSFDTRRVKSCRNMGLNSIGDLLNFPSAELSKRLGLDALDALEKMLGKKADLKKKIVPHTYFKQTLFFSEGLSNTQILLFPMKRLLGEFSRFLTLRQLHCQGFIWVFEHHYNEISSLSVDMAQAKNNAHDFFSLTQLKLERYKTNSSIESITLNSKDLQAAQHEITSWLEPVSGQAGGLGELVDSLKHRLGDFSVHALCERKSHWPELSVTSQYENHYLMGSNTPNKNAANKKNEKNPFNKYLAVEEPLRPIFILVKPMPLNYRNGQLFYNNEKLSIDKYFERVERRYLIHSRSRDYYIATQSNGVCCWVFYSAAMKAWYLHGIFS